MVVGNCVHALPLKNKKNNNKKKEHPTLLSGTLPVDQTPASSSIGTLRCSDLKRTFIL